MSSLNELREHPLPADPWDCGDPDARSFHEAACDLARQLCIRPDLCEDLPVAIMDALSQINDAVAKVAQLSHS